MYISKLYKTEDFEVARQIIRENAFALLISATDKIRATHAMMLLNEENPENIFLESHISSANPQAKILKNGDEVLCDFLGNHTYISSSWYEKTNVSTWNYEAVQIEGTVELMNDEDLYHHLEKLTYKYEQTQKCPMLVEKMGKEYVYKEMRGTFGIKIFPTQISIAQKFSQNRNDADYQSIIENLSDSKDSNALQIAEKMKKIR